MSLFWNGHGYIMKKLWLLLLLLVLSGSEAWAADEIHFTLKSPTSVTFNWRGSETSLNYGTTSGSLGSSATATTPAMVPTSSSGPWKQAALTGLTANTTYFYKIGTSAQYSFKTPPVNGTADFTIYALGNFGNNLIAPAMPAVQNLIAGFDPAFVIGLGDYAQRSTAGKLTTDSFFSALQVWSTKSAFMPVWGDLDWTTNTFEDFKNYKGRFDLPNSKTSTGTPLAGGKDWYWFDYGNTRFIAMPDIMWNGSLIDWIINASVIMSAAQADANIKHIVTMGHRSAYSSGHFLSSTKLREALDALGDTYSKYQLALSANSGGYERSSAQHGVTHVVVGTAGQSMYQDGVGLWLTATQPAWSAFRRMHLGALRVNFVDTGITGTFICGPTGGGTTDATCDVGSALDTFYIPVTPDAQQPNPGPTLTGISATNITQTGADIAWNCTAVPCTGQVNYGLTTSYGSNTTLEPSFNYTSHLQTLSGLTAGTVYHYRVRSSNSTGVESVSADQTFTTVAVSPTGPVLSAFSASALSTTGATLNWTCNVPCTGYYDIGTTTAYGTTNSPGQNDTTYSAHAQVKTGLTENTLYHWRAHSKNAANVETISQDQTFTTLTSGGGGTTPGTYHAPPPTSAFTVNVRNTGATGNGVTDDTAAIQAAINQVAGTGGTVLVPSGTYLTRASTSYPFGAINLGSNMTFKMESGAIIKQAPTDRINYYTLFVLGKTNVNIVGPGKLQGERHQHIPTTLDYGWGVDESYGFGVFIRGGSSNIYVDGITAIEYWGDGICVGADGSGVNTNINIYNNILDANRRQGMSLAEADGMQIRGNVFSNTGGVYPAAGIDIEPIYAQQWVINVIIDGNQFIGNTNGAGIVTTGNYADHRIENITVTNNIFQNNYWGVYFENLSPGSSQSGNTFINNPGGNFISSGR
jgi:hypothetical protein